MIPNEHDLFLNTIFVIGIFLGYSILQLLEYGVSGIMSHIITFQDFLARRIVCLKDERKLTSQKNHGFQVDERGVKNNCNKIVKDSLFEGKL